jgi:hypothetical protein
MAYVSISSNFALNPALETVTCSDVLSGQWADRLPGAWACARRVLVREPKSPHSPLSGLNSSHESVPGYFYLL